MVEMGRGVKGWVRKDVGGEAGEREERGMRKWGKGWDGREREKGAGGGRRRKGDGE